MEKVELSRRKVLQTAVAALCVEVGYLSVESHALGSLTEATQSCKIKHSMTSTVYCFLKMGHSSKFLFAICNKNFFFLMCRIFLSFVGDTIFNSSLELD